ncbi:MAG: hypothetical protein LBV72_04770 [Tannerella sp.]|jgi:hypothetical protein|nr:hypothetical protein [Tannerella sp.]
MRTKILLSVFFTVMILAVQAQEYYIVTDQDGYTNIREKPTTNAKIIDKASKYELIFDADYFCGDEDFDFEKMSPNWIPVKKDYVAPVGYVYKKNICSLDSMPMLRKHINRGESDTIICANDTLQVRLILKPFDFDAHKIEYLEVTWDDDKRLHIDGEIPKCLLVSEFTRETTVKHREIKELTVNNNGAQYTLPIRRIKSYFNVDGMTVFIGSEGELYISIGCGDGGEAYHIMLSVVNGKILFAKESDAC